MASGLSGWCTLTRQLDATFSSGCGWPFGQEQAVDCVTRLDMGCPNIRMRRMACRMWAAAHGMSNVGCGAWHVECEMRRCGATRPGPLGRDLPD